MEEERKRVAEGGAAEDIISLKDVTKVSLKCQECHLSPKDVTVGVFLILGILLILLKSYDRDECVMS